METKSHNVIFKRFTLFILSLLAVAASAQTEGDSSIFDIQYIPMHNDTMMVFKYIENGQTKQAAIIEGDTVPWLVLDEVLLIDDPTFDSQEARRRYYRLKRKVMRVYPYAVLAGDRLDSLNLKLDNLADEDDREDYIEEYNEFLENRFEPELRKLTHSEGQILCKLIYRETGLTVFELISDYRSSWTAFWWNVNAGWFEISLKEKYNPESDDEDKLVEQILNRSFVQELLEERVPFYPPENADGR